MENLRIYIQSYICRTLKNVMEDHILKNKQKCILRLNRKALQKG